MDQYFFDYSQQGNRMLDESQQYFMNDSMIQRRVQQQAELLKQNQLYKQGQQQFPTNSTARCLNYNQNHLQFQIECQNQNSQRNSKIRKENKIQCSSKIQIQSIFTFSGSKNDTVQLNTNFKTIISSCLLSKKQQLQNNQKIIIDQFEQNVASFKSMKKIFGTNKKLNQKCQKIICSSSIIKKIFQNRAKFSMKLQMIKYIEALNKNIKSQKITRWKSIRKI